MTGIEWDEPPRRNPNMFGHVRNDAIKAFADELRANPKRWAKYPLKPTASQASANSTAWGIRRGLRLAFQPAGAFEATSRTVDGRTAVYVRYIGDGGAS